ncbi:MAG: transporter related protein [Solirubrobacterales bacterium]|nr:transporter related protein [Solirubrobacterales bacterium]
MTTFLTFALLGLGTGAIYALLGQGLVLIFRGSGILNLAHGAFALAGGYLYYELHELHGHGVGVSLAATVVVIACVGAATDQLLLRRLRSASALARLIATMGLLVAAQSWAVLRYGSGATLVTPLFTGEPVHLLGTTLAYDRMWLVFIAVALTAFLAIVIQRTRIGWVMSAVAENQRAAAALGWSPERMSALTWAFGAGLAALAGILVAPVTQLSVTTLTLLVIPALAAALVGGFRSFGLTLLGGLGLGVAEAEVGRYVHITGASSAVPLLVIVVLLLMRGSTLPLRGYVNDRPPGVGFGRLDPRLGAPAFIGGLLLIGFGLEADWLSAVVVLFAVGTILLSVVVLTGYAGQLSLAQYALAGVGALIAARLAQAHGWPFVPALVAGMIGTTLVGLVFALPALRARGVELAVITLSMGVAAQELLFNSADITGGATGTPIPDPHLFGVDIGSFDHPVRYALVAFGLFAGCAVAVANLRRGRAGRRLLAVRTNERAAAALGINVLGAKLHAFAVAGALAGLGGVVLAFQSSTVVYDGFSPFASINAVGQAVIGGIGFILGPAFGAGLASGSIGQTAITSTSDNASQYLGLIGGIGVMLTLLVHRDGVASALAGPGRLVVDRLRPPTDDGAWALAVEPVAAERVAPKRLEVRGAIIRYGGVVAVDDVSLAVEPGRILGLIGPNGAGKTSIIDGIAGFTSMSGEVLLDGVRIDGWSAHRRAQAGLVRSFQSLELFEDMTVLENLQTACDARDLGALVSDLVRPGKAQLQPAAAAAVREFGLEAVLHKRPPELAYGQRRLVAIARAVASEPSVVLLDEPAAGLDENESLELAYLVRRLADDWGIGVLLIEHDMDFVMGLCDELLVVDFGHPIAQGPPAEVRKDPAAIKAYLGDETDAVEVTA